MSNGRGDDICNVAKKFVADKILIAARRRMTHPELFRDAKVMVKMLPSTVDQIVLDVDAYVIGMPKERIDVDERWPSDWWQSVRERWFPGWWLKRWPVQYKSVSIHRTIYSRVCPHVREPNEALHLRWMEGE